VFFVDPDPTLVWHYTTAGGLLGILNRAAAQKQNELLKSPWDILDSAFTMRFTDALYLNDPLELRYGREKLADLLQARSTGLNDEDRQEMAAVLEWLRADASAIPDAGQLAGGTYVACFSTQADSLSQWRGYAPGRGYSIGFDLEGLGAMVAPICEEPKDDWEKELVFRPRVDSVRYGDDDALKYFEEIVDQIVNPVEMFATRIPRRFLTELALSNVKQKPYDVEGEVRAVIIQGPTELRREFRDGALGLTPFITASYLPFGDKGAFPVIRAVKVGPGGDAELRKQAVLRLLDNEGFDTDDEVKVTTSEFEYRGW
jgi:hypothetical protein